MLHVINFIIFWLCHQARSSRNEHVRRKAIVKLSTFQYSLLLVFFLVYLCAFAGVCMFICVFLHMFMCTCMYVHVHVFALAHACIC